MGNGDSCGDSAGRDREGKRNEMGRTQCMEQQKRSDLGPGLHSSSQVVRLTELVLFSCNIQILQSKNKRVFPRQRDLG